MEPRQIVSIGLPTMSEDGSLIFATAKFTDGTSLDLRIPVDEVGTYVSYFALLNDDLSDKGLIEPPNPTVSGPIRVHGVGFGTAPHSLDTLLVLKLAGCQLGFAMDTKQLGEMASQLSRMAATLSADHSKPQ